MPAPLPDSTPPRVRDAVAEAKARLEALYGDRLARVVLYGSYARGEQTAGSDLDPLVEFDEVPGMLGFVGLAHRIEDRVGLPVDLFTRPMLKPRIAPRVERDLVAV